MEDVLLGVIKDTLHQFSGAGAIFAVSILFFMGKLQAGFDKMSKETRSDKKELTHEFGSFKKEVTNEVKQIGGKVEEMNNNIHNEFKSIRKENSEIQREVYAKVSSLESMIYTLFNLNNNDMRK